jgi:hypothetical protein
MDGSALCPIPPCEMIGLVTCIIFIQSLQLIKLIYSTGPEYMGCIM